MRAYNFDYGKMRALQQKLATPIITNKNPLFVSPGHNIGIDDSKLVVLGSVKNYKIPEPIRRAHIEAGQYKKSII